MRIYIAGPMSGIKNFNFPAFDAAAEWLRHEGHVVTNPADLDRDEGFKPNAEGKISEEERRKLLGRDFIELAKCDAIYMLPGWGSSRGARLEYLFACDTGLEVMYAEDAEPVTYMELADIRGIPDPADNKPAKLDTYYKTLTDEVRVTDPETGGQKGQKLAQFGALDPRALMEVAKVAGFGAGKYSRLNFTKGYDWSLTFDAMMRHVMAWWDGEDTDPESGLHHLGHAGWHALAGLCFALRGRGTDDRLSAQDWMKEE